MSQQSRMHSYLSWTKERIDEMDAALASFEAKASQVQADSEVKAKQFIADLKTRRDEFQATAKKQAAEGEEAHEDAIGITVARIRSRDQNLLRHFR